METSPATRSEPPQGRTARWTTHLVLETWSECSKKETTSAFWHPGVVLSNALATVWIAFRGSVVKCARSQVRPFNEDDEATHEHVTEHVRDLGERLLHEGDISYEDITGQDEPPVYRSPATGARQVRQRKEVKMNQLSPAERHEFLKSMEVECQTLLKNHAAKVLSLEGTALAQAHWPERAMDTRQARTWKPDDSKTSARRVKARPIIKDFTDPDLLDIVSHSPTLSWEGFYDSLAVRVQPWTQVAVWGCTVQLLKNS